MKIDLTDAAGSGCALDPLKGDLVKCENAVTTSAVVPSAIAGNRLTDEERARLAGYEHLVADPTLARGAALAAIREKRLYRETHATFEDYCRDRWKLSRTHVNRLIQAAEVLKNVTPIGVTTLREAHARELAGLTPDDQRLVARFVKATAPNGHITAPHLKSVVTVVRDAMIAGAIDDGTGVQTAWDELPDERKMPLIQVAVDEETYERNQRQRTHINEALRVGCRHEWFTPAHVIDAARQVLGAIDVDPASCEQANATVRATTYYNTTSNGLQQDWPGRFWLNPPYGRWAGPFVDRLLDLYARHVTTEAIALLNAAATDTTWFEPLFDYPLCFARRIQFQSPTGPTKSATHGSVLVYLGPQTDRFVEVFREMGPVVRRIDRGSSGREADGRANEAICSVRT